METKFNPIVSLLRTFFLDYLWLGVVLVLIAIILDLHYPSQPQRGMALSSLIHLIQSVGIAILVASIFTFAAGSSRFMSKIRGLLQDIVISRNFLGNIDNESKKEALRAIIRPSIEEQKTYSNLEDYYTRYIDQTLSINRKCFRSNYSVSSVVRYDDEKQRVVVKVTANYRVYPSTDGYADIVLGFLDYDEAFPPTWDHIIVSAPNGQRMVHQPFVLEPGKRDEENFLSGKLNVCDIGQNMSHLDVEICYTSFEQDHWAQVGLQTLQPTDGFRYHLVCEQGVEILSKMVFAYGVYILVDQRSKTELLVSCTQWLNEGAGVSVVVSRPPGEA